MPAGQPLSATCLRRYLTSFDVTGVGAERHLRPCRRLVRRIQAAVSAGDLSVPQQVRSSADWRVKSSAARGQSPDAASQSDAAVTVGVLESPPQYRSLCSRYSAVRLWSWCGPVQRLARRSVLLCPLSCRSRPGPPLPVVWSGRATRRSFRSVWRRALVSPSAGPRHCSSAPLSGHTASSACRRRRRRRRPAAAAAETVSWSPANERPIQCGHPRPAPAAPTPTRPGRGSTDRVAGPPQNWRLEV